MRRGWDEESSRRKAQSSNQSRSDLSFEMCCFESLFLRAAGREALQEAGEIGDVEGRGRRAGVAVGVGVLGGELLQEAGEVGDVRDRRRGAGVAVGVAGWGEVVVETPDQGALAAEAD